MEPEKIERINELAKKKKEQALSQEEILEHETLRREYIDGFKANMRKVLEGVKIQQEDGTVKPLEKKKKS
ncbi:MAG: DUF896 domain-containing protein [Clostridiales bacterium]|nr:DUF896 domain-containing protein [Clostridiales bacterium]